MSVEMLTKGMLTKGMLTKGMLTKGMLTEELRVDFEDEAGALAFVVCSDADASDAKKEDVGEGDVDWNVTAGEAFLEGGRDGDGGDDDGGFDVDGDIDKGDVDGGAAWGF